METTDKVKNEAQHAKGNVKEAAGAVTGNESLEAQGKSDQIKADLKQAGGKLKDAVKH